MNAPTYNFAYLDEQTKRMIRRAILKAIAIPGYQVPFASREMPMPYGWGTGGVQVTAAILGPDDVLKVIDQGSDDTTNAISIRRFFEKTADVATTTATADATVIQTRHRIPEAPLHVLHFGNAIERHRGSAGDRKIDRARTRVCRAPLLGELGAGLHWPSGLTSAWTSTFERLPSASTISSVSGTFCPFDTGFARPISIM